MDREEILAKVRQENKVADERELHIRLKAGRISKAAGVAIAFILVFIEGIFLDIPAIGWTALTIAFGMNAIEDWIIVGLAKVKTEWFSTLLDTAILIGSAVMLIKTVM